MMIVFTASITYAGVSEIDKAPRLSINDSTTGEHYGYIKFLIQLDKPSEVEVFVDYLTVGKTAIATADYITHVGTMKFASGEVKKEIFVTLLDDSLPENTETFQLKLNYAYNAIIVTPYATGYIIDNETQSIIEASASDGGKIIPSGLIPVAMGNSQTFHYEANDGYQLEKIMINGVYLPELIENEYTFYNVQMDQIIKAIFKEIETVPHIFDIPNDTQPRTEKYWTWHANKKCTFRFAIDKNPSWQPTGPFENITSTTINDIDGIWYIHVQAKDNTGSLSNVVSAFAILDNTKPIITGIQNDQIQRKSKTWTWNVDDDSNCLFRYAIDQNTTWKPSGEYSAIRTAQISGSEGKWYIHVEAIDIAGNVSDIATGSVQLIKSTIQFSHMYSAGDESITPIQLELMLSHASSENITVYYRTKDIQTLHQSSQGKDYLLPDNNFVVIEPGELKGYIELSIIDDNICENDESCVIELYNPCLDFQLNEYNLFIYSIIDNDLAGVSIVESFDQSEVHEDGINDSFTISLNSEPSDDVKISIHTDDQMTVSPYELFFTSTNWNQEQSVFIHAVDDDIYELPPHYSLITFSADTEIQKYKDLVFDDIAVTIGDNDSKPTVRFNKVYYQGYESFSSVHLPLILTHSANQDVIIDYVKEKYGTATEDKDYTLSSYQTVIKAFESEGNIEINVINDKYSESNETIALKIVQANIALIGANKNICEYEILDDDYPGLSINGLSNGIALTEGEFLAYSILLKTTPESLVTIRIKSNNNNAIHLSNNELYFTRENWNIPQWVSLAASDDSIFNEHLTIMITHTIYSTDPDYQIIPEKEITITIHENDQKPSPPEITAKTPTNEIDVTWHIESRGGTENFECKRNSQAIQCSSGQMSTYFPEGKHILSVIEEVSPGQWTEASKFEIEKDTGMPCSQIDVPKAITAENKSFTITYSYEDKYQCQTYINKECGTGIDHCPGLFDRGSGVYEIELWVQLPNSNEFKWVDSDKSESIDGYFNYTATQEGVYQFYARAIDRANNAEPEPYYPDNSKIAASFYVNNFSGYAIIAVGSVANQEGLKSHTLTANNIVKQLKCRNFWPEHIKYFNPYVEKQPGETDFEAHGDTYLNAFENVMTEWASAQIKKLSGPLYIILIDHGSQNTFHLTGTQSLTASQFNTYLQTLDDIENKSEIIIILGSCYSGSFIDEIAGKGRIVVTSAVENEPSYRGPYLNPGGVRDGGFFITHLFNELTKGRNLMDSFNTSVLRTEAFTFSPIITTKAPFYDYALQHPLLDDNGKDGNNFLPFNGDGSIARNIIMGHSEMESAAIESITIVPETLNGNDNVLNIEACVNDFQKIDRLWIEVRKPDMVIQDMSLKYMSDHVGLQQTIESKEFEMTIHSNNTYRLACDEFDIPGKYRIFFYAKDKEGFTSGYKEAVFYKSKENNQSPESFSLISPVNMESNFYSTEFSDVILEWENTIDPENDQVTYSITLSTDTDSYEKTHIFDTIYFVSLPKSWDKKEVRWKVKAIDTFGNISETPTWKFKIDNKIDAHQNIWGAIVYFQVHDIDTKRPVPNAKIKMTSNDINQNLVMNQSGLSIKRFMKTGSVNLTISASNYSSLTNETIEIMPGEMQSFNYSLDFKSTIGDINRNGKRDIGDAIKCLQVLSGLDDQTYYDHSALIGDFLELRDMIFILQHLSEIK
jgi:hypothetical protein